MAMASLVGRTMTAIMFGEGYGFVQETDSGQSHEVLKIMNSAKIMAWLWYEVGQEDRHEFGRD